VKAKIEKGKLTFDIQDLVDSLSKEDYANLCRYMVADRYLFAAVLECVADESRLGSFFSDDEDGEWWFGSEQTLELREKLLPLMPSIARRAVEQALYERNSAKAEAESYRNWAWRLYHNWPDAERESRPEGPGQWAPASLPSAEEVDQRMKEGT